MEVENIWKYRPKMFVMFGVSLQSGYDRKGSKKFCICFLNFNFSFNLPPKQGE